MKKRLLLAACAAVLAVSVHGLVQAPEVTPVVKLTTDPRNLKDLMTLAGAFPTLDELTNALGDNYNTLRQADSSLVNKLNASAPEPGWGAGILRGVFLDNITLKVDMVYTKTLETKVTDDSEAGVTRSQLAGLRFEPIYEATWSLPLNKLIAGFRQTEQSTKVVQRAIRVDRDKQLSTLLKPYGDFDQARFEFLNGAQSADSSKDCDNFYKMKSAALALLQAAGKTGKDEFVQKWAVTQCLLSRGVQLVQTSEPR